MHGAVRGCQLLLRPQRGEQARGCEGPWEVSSLWPGPLPPLHFLACTASPLRTRQEGSSLTRARCLALHPPQERSSQGALHTLTSSLNLGSSLEVGSIILRSSFSSAGTRGPVRHGGRAGTQGQPAQSGEMAESREPRVFSARTRHTGRPWRDGPGQGLPTGRRTGAPLAFASPGRRHSHPLTLPASPLTGSPVVRGLGPWVRPEQTPGEDRREPTHTLGKLPGENGTKHIRGKSKKKKEEEKRS